MASASSNRFQPATGRAELLSGPRPSPLRIDRLTRLPTAAKKRGYWISSLARGLARCHAQSFLSIVNTGLPFRVPAAVIPSKEVRLPFQSGCKILTHNRPFLNRGGGETKLLLARIEPWPDELTWLIRGEVHGVVITPRSIRASRGLCLRVGRSPLARISNGPRRKPRGCCEQRASFPAMGRRNANLGTPSLDTCRHSSSAGSSFSGARAACAARLHR